MCAAAHARCALRCSPSSRTPRRARPVGRGIFYRPASRLPRRPAPRRSTGAGGGGATASAPRASEDDARLPRGYRLRLAEANEVEVLHALLLAEPPGDRKGWGREQLEEEFRNTVSTIVVAESPLGIVDGFVVVWLVAGEAQILNLAVRPTKRRRGIGGALVRHAATMRSVGLPAVLEVDVSNHGAIALYERQGFHRAGLLKGYYPDGSDAIIMRID